MGLNLTTEQQRESAIQRAIESAFKFNDYANSTEILIAAITRIARARNGGKPLTADAAGDLAQRLFETLKGTTP
jgi:hypothetical protein